MPSDAAESVECWHPWGMSDLARVRQMSVDEANLVVDYFVGASVQSLAAIGLDASRLPTRNAWISHLAQDWSRPAERRESSGVVWEIDQSLIGFSTLTDIRFGDSASVHLHIFDEANRGRGYGTLFVRLAAEWFADEFCLLRVYSEPNAFNTPANRALQGAGFRWVSTQESEPDNLSLMQTTNRWVRDAPAV